MSTVTIVATVEAGNEPPRVRLDVTDTGTPNLTAATVTRLDPDGRTVTVRTEDGNPLVLTTSGSDRVGLLYDYEMPYGEPVSYSTVETPGSSSAEVTVDVTQVWLIHPGVPELSMPINLRADSFAQEEWDVQQGVHWPMGRDTPVVQTDGSRKAPSDSVTVRTDTLRDLAKLKSLLSDASPLLLDVPAGLGLGFDTAYIQVGKVRPRRLVNIGGDPRRAIELPFQVVGRPVGGSQAERTLLDLLAFPTLDSLMTEYATFDALLAGP